MICRAGINLNLLTSASILVSCKHHFVICLNSKCRLYLQTFVLCKLCLITNFEFCRNLILSLTSVHSVCDNKVKIGHCNVLMKSNDALYTSYLHK